MLLEGFLQKHRLVFLQPLSRVRHVPILRLSMLTRQNSLSQNHLGVQGTTCPELEAILLPLFEGFCRGSPRGCCFCQSFSTAQSPSLPHFLLLKATGSSPVLCPLLILPTVLPPVSPLLSPSSPHLQAEGWFVLTPKHFQSQRDKEKRSPGSANAK